MRRKTGNASQVIAVRVEPAIEQRLRLLAEVTGRSQSFFLKQLIEQGLDAMESTWLPNDVASRVRTAMPPPQPGTTADLFADLHSGK